MYRSSNGKAHKHQCQGDHEHLPFLSDTAVPRYREGQTPHEGPDIDRLTDRDRRAYKGEELAQLTRPERSSRKAWEWRSKPMFQVS